MVGITAEVIQVKVAAPPVKGKANKELITFLSSVLGVSKGSLTIVKGHTNRHKIVAIEGLTQDQITRRLSLKNASADVDATSIDPHR